jgi:hypothetical protein
LVGNPSRNIGPGLSRTASGWQSTLAAKASTPAEHRVLEEYFTALARRYDAEAKKHAAFASGLRTTRIEQAAAIHSRLWTLATNSAKEAAAGAQMHRELAAVGR